MKNNNACNTGLCAFGFAPARPYAKANRTQAHDVVCQRLKAGLKTGTQQAIGCSAACNANAQPTAHTLPHTL